MPDPNKFGAYLKKLQEERGITLRELAKRVDLSPGYLSRLENGKAALPGEEKILAIAEALDVEGKKLLAISGRVSSDLIEIMKANPLLEETLVSGLKGRRLSTTQTETIRRWLSFVFELKLYLFTETTPMKVAEGKKFDKQAVARQLRKIASQIEFPQEQNEAKQASLEKRMVKRNCGSENR